MDALEEWLDANGSVDGSFGHLLLEQKAAIDQDLIDALRPYFESAHLDAREHFHTQVGISLHPDAVSGPLPVDYPSCLPSKAHRGLFGEVIAGLVTEAYQNEFVGGHPWQVPVFLFRQHDDVENYLWALRFDPARRREIYGRHGSDFIGIAVNGQGEVIRVIVGEAKWRATLTQSVVDNLLLGPKQDDADTGRRVHSGRGIWFEVNRDALIPHGLRQLQKILEQRDPNGHGDAILSIDRAIVGQAPPPARTNMVLLVGNAGKGRDEATCLMPFEQAPDEYTAPHDLQLVEVVLDGGEALIDGLYASMWQDL